MNFLGRAYPGRRSPWERATAGPACTASNALHAMPRRRTTRKRSRGRGGVRLPRPTLRLPRVPRLPELEQHHHDVIGLGLVALAAFFAFVIYLHWNGGRVGGALASALVFLVGGVAYLVPVALFAAGTLLVLRPMLHSVRPFKSGGALLLLALMLGLAGGLFGLGPANPARHGFMHPDYFRHHGGLLGEALYWAASTLFQSFGAHIIFIFMLAAGVLLPTGASAPGVIRGTRARVAPRSRRSLPSTGAVAAVHTLHPAPPA